MKRQIISMMLAAGVLVSSLATAAYAEGTPATNETAAQETQLNLYTADSNKCGENATWRLSADGTLTISGTGATYDYEYSYSFNSSKTSIFYENEDIKRVVIKAGITRIGDNLFEKCSNIEAVDIPATVSSIGEGVFENCKSLTEITLPDAVKTISAGLFSYCENLSSVKMAKDITSIGNAAFDGCTKLEAIDIPSTVTSIGQYAFESCTSLKSVTIPDGITSIDSGTFSGCDSLEWIVIPASVKEIHYKAFRFTSNVKTVYFGGTEEEWEALGITEWSRAKIYYQCTGPDDVPEPTPKPTAAPTATPEPTATPAPTAEPTATPVPTPTETPFYGTGTAGFVERLYDICLGREPDEAGMIYWIQNLRSGKVSGAQAAYGFIFSDEFKNCNPCNDCFVTRLYRAFMGREPDADGKAYWLSQLENGKTRGEVFGGFALSAEFEAICRSYNINRGSGDWSDAPFVLTGNCEYCGKENQTAADFVTRLYSVCLDREPDESGLNDWIQQLKAGKSGREVASGFVFSREFINKNYSNADYVEHLYAAFMGRESDAAGKADWVGRLDAGTSREEVFNGFAGSQEFTNICARYGIIRG